MTLTDTLPVALETHQLKALRSADKVIFRLRDGLCTLEAVRNAEHTSDGFEQVIRIPVNSSVTDYSREYAYVPSHEDYTGFFYFGSAQYDDRAKTLLQHLRTGDALTFRWVRGNASPVLNEACVVRDELHLRIDRGKRREHWLIAVEVGKDNTARMIQRRL